MLERHRRLGAVMRCLAEGAEGPGAEGGAKVAKAKRHVPLLEPGAHTGCCFFWFLDVGICVCENCCRGLFGVSYTVGMILNNRW